MAEQKFETVSGLKSHIIDFTDRTGTNTISAEIDSVTDQITFTGDLGQLFAIRDSFTGTLFSVTDISAIPYIRVEDTGEVFLVESAGNVGVGTTSPSEKLDVDGNLKVSGNFILEGSVFAEAVGGTRENIIIFKTGKSDFSAGGISNFTTDSGDFSPAFWGYNNDDNRAGISLYGFVSDSGDSLTNDMGVMDLHVFKIPNNSTDPINDTRSSFVNRNLFTVRHSTSYIITIDVDENVGVGEISPSEKVDVDGNVKSNRILVDGGNATSPSISFASDENTGIYRSAADEMSFSSGGSQKFFINSTDCYFADRLLINTTSNVTPYSDFKIFALGEDSASGSSETLAYLRLNQTTSHGKTSFISLAIDHDDNTSLGNGTPIYSGAAYGINTNLNLSGGINASFSGSITAYGSYASVTVSGSDADTNTTRTVYGFYSNVSAVTSNAAGTTASYGGYFSAIGNTTGSSSAYGILATAGFAVNNWAAFFSGRVEIETLSNLANPALIIDQNDVDEAFINFEGTSAANTSNNISTANVGSGTTNGPATANWTHTEMIKVEINGSARWIPAYTVV